MSDESSARARALEVTPELLARYGATDDGMRLSSAKLAAWLQISRSELYRRASSMRAVAVEVTWALATSRSWVDDLLRCSPANGLAWVLPSALTTSHAVGATARAVVSASPPAHRRRELADIERTTLRALEGWLAEHLASHALELPPGIGTDDLAILVYGLVEGALLRSTATLDPVHADLTTVPDVVTGMLGAITGSDATGRAHGAAAPGPRAPAADLVSTIATAIDRGEAAAFATTPRYVPVGTLAKRASLGERTVRHLWPTPSSFNEDVHATALASIREGLAREIAVTKSLAFGSRRAVYGFAPTVHRAIVGFADPVRGYPFATLSVWDRSHQRSLGRATDQLFAEIEVTALALLAGTGYHLRRGISPKLYVVANARFLLGYARLCQAHPDLGARTVSVDGRDEPLLGYGGHQIARSLIAAAPGRVW